MIKDISPEIVIGTGGYVCWPVLKAAQMARIPTVLHESNAVPGLCTRLLAPKCTRVLLNFPGSEGELRRKDNTAVVGNPILSSLTSETREGARRRLGISSSEFMILSFGGSGGAQILNKHAIALMQNYCMRVNRIRHVHATGRKYYAMIKGAYPALARGSGGCIVHPFIEDMSTYMKAADVVICRCGAMTLSEVASAGVVPILIPSPNVTDNHQYKNAKLFVDKGAALMIEESELNDRTLIDAVRYLENNPQLRAKMRERLKEFSTENSREIIYRHLKEILAK
jgi:UDP-N-acetylglucosamine--N-acetylmuramyl-(pentapeptide) pyrophosphoryl-undecaprenol N-acetylglucosamine transferase